MFGGSRLDKRIEAYIDQIVSQLSCDEEEKRGMADEMRDHLYLLKKEYLEKGLSGEEATQKALESFGEQKQLAKGLQKAMFPFKRGFKMAAWLLFSLYALIVSFKLLFQRIFFVIYFHDRYHDSFFNGYVFTPRDFAGRIDFMEYIKWNSNIIPFKNTMGYITEAENYNLDVILFNTLGNVLIFLPLGIFLPLLYKKYCTLSKVALASAIISLSIEILQFTLRIGQFDIDDILLNTMGTAIGFILLKGMKRLIFPVTKGRFARKITN